MRFQFRGLRAYQLLRTAFDLWRQQGGRTLLLRLVHWLEGERRYHDAPARPTNAHPYTITIDPRLPRLTIYPAADTNYHRFIQQFEPSPADLRHQCQTPLPVQLTLVTEWTPHMELTLGSVLTQTHAGWHWFITGSDVKIATHPSITVLPLGAPLTVTTTHVVLLTAGDVLAPHALYTVAAYLTEHPTADLLYTDGDTLDASQCRTRPHFWPDWSPELLLSTNLGADLLIVRQDFLPTCQQESISRWELTLRLSEQTDRIHHLPHILVHHPALSRDAIHSVRPTSEFHRHLARYPLTDLHITAGRITWSMDWPRVSIIIPSRDHAAILENCLRSLYTLTDYPAFDVTIVDTGSTDPATFDLYRAYPQVRVVNDAQQPFNFSHACNFGAAGADGQLFLFLNNDTQVIQADWLKRMVQWFAIDAVGIVGCKLLYPHTDTIQHGGVIVGLGGMAGHLFQQLPDPSTGLFGDTGWYRNFLAVTAACLLICADLFRAVGGFEEEFMLNYSDVDLCLKAHAASQRIVYTPDAVLWHYEGTTHRARIPRRDFETAARRWESVLRAGDPYFNPNLSVNNATPRLRPHPDDNAFDVHQGLMQRLPAKPIIQLPDDLL